MIDRRGFLKLLGVLGAATAVPLQSLLASPEATQPVAPELGEGLWWIPDGGQPVLLNEIGYLEAREEREIVPDFEHEHYSWVNRVKQSGRSRHRLSVRFSGPLLNQDERRGTLRMRLKMFGDQQFEWSDCWLTAWSMESGRDALVQTATFETGYVTRSLIG